MAEVGIEIEKEKSKKSSHVENQKKNKKVKKTNNEDNSATEPYIPSTTSSRRF